MVRPPPASCVPHYIRDWEIMLTGLLQCISPEVIILRVAIGRTMDSTSRATNTAIRFGTHQPAETVSSTFPSSADGGNFTPESGSTMLDSRPDLVNFKGDV